MSKITFKETRQELNIPEDEPIFYDFTFFYDKKIKTTEKKLLVNTYYQAAIKLVEEDSVDINTFLDTKDLLLKNNVPESEIESSTITVPKMKIILALEEYYSKMMEEYFLTVEDIAKFLNLSRIMVQTKIIPHLDEMRFVCSRDSENLTLKKNYLKAKTLIKNINYSKHFITEDTYSLLLKNLDELKINKKDAIKILEIYQNSRVDLFRKKSLYSLSSFLKFLKSYTKELYSNNIIALDLTNEEYNLLLKKHHLLRYDTYICEISNALMNKIKSQANFTEYVELDIQEIAKKHFVFANTLEKAIDKYFSDDKLFSMATLKIFWDFFYDSQVKDSLKFLKYTKVEISFSEKPSVRYILSKSDVINEIITIAPTDNDSNKNNIVKIPMESKVLEYLYTITTDIKTYILNEILTLEALKLNDKYI